MRILGINALNHDAAVSDIEDGDIKFAAHSERYSRKKNDYLLNDDIDPESATPYQVCRAVSAIREKILPDPSIRPNVGSLFKNLIVEYFR